MKNKVQQRFNDALSALNDRNLQKAEKGFRRVVELDRSHVPALNLLTVVLMSLGRFREAEPFISRAVNLNQNSDVSFYNYGLIAKQLNKPQLAYEQFTKALRINPNVHETWNNRGAVCNDLNNYELAVSDFNKAIELNQSYAEGYANKGKSLALLKRYDEAFAAYDKALSIKSDLVEARLGRGNVFFEFNRIAEALADYQKVLENDQMNILAKIASCFAELQIIYDTPEEILSRRAAYEKKLAALDDDVERGNVRGDPKDVLKFRQPFYLAYQGYNDRDLQRVYGSMACRIMGREIQNASLTPLAEADEKIRIGFVSGFFYKHSNWKIPIKGWLSQLDRNQFEVFCYHLGKERDSETEIAATMSDRFVQRIMTADDWRNEILADAPHVLIYPGLFMEDSSLELAAQRLAPVQCNSWGHPDTSGMQTIDYFLGSDLMEPPDATEHYTEQLVRLPNLSIYYEPSTTEAPSTSRSELGLRQDAVIFWCGQSLYKYLPQYDEVFSRISESVKDCQFVFVKHTGAEQIADLFWMRLERAFAMKDLKAADHCVILPRMNQSQFLSAIGQCDIFLDSIGWSGCNSTLESLPQNLPIITLQGPLMRGRHSAAILRMMNITETITHDVDEYISKAIRLAQNLDERAALSRKISVNKHLVYRDRECVAALEEFLVRVGRRQVQTDIQ
jgi:protein O-GlcNAc transferase